MWREELEIPDLETVVEDLFEEIRPLYEMLHAVIRHKLYEKFGPEGIDLRGPIPVHLLGTFFTFIKKNSFLFVYQQAICGVRTGQL